mmetsp:Transcript_100024/g.282411  ORF Transcript_100024/g.282411 Transcript_100024/m.282411 type:complete len:235 (+) Transcript_100024:705-1409(+)
MRVPRGRPGCLPGVGALGNHARQLCPLPRRSVEEPEIREHFVSVAAAENDEELRSCRQRHGAVPPSSRGASSGRHSPDLHMDGVVGVHGNRRRRFYERHEELRALADNWSRAPAGEHHARRHRRAGGVHRPSQVQGLGRVARSISDLDLVSLERSSVDEACLGLARVLARGVGPNATENKGPIGMVPEDAPTMAIAEATPRARRHQGGGNRQGGLRGCRRHAAVQGQLPRPTEL